MRKLGIIAGEGALPLALETWARRRRIPFVVARIRTRDGGCELGSFAMSDISGVINLFKAKGVDTVVMAGGIYYARVGFSLKLLEFAARLLFVRNRHDGVLRLAIAELEKNGFRVVGV
ncbi:MAG: hypothetical protein LBL52_03340, partial [Rickettsiales bacterium]|nr:hypothetical protein [Rickettsiales bacterium]